MDITINDIIEYSKDENVSKKEFLFLLYLYKNSKNQKNPSEPLTREDIINLLRALNDSLKNASDTSITADKIQRVLVLIDKFLSTFDNNDFNDLFLSTFDSKDFIDLFYLLFEENKPIVNSEEILEWVLKRGEKGR